MSFRMRVGIQVFSGVLGIVTGAGRANADLISPATIIDSPVAFQGTVDVTLFSVDSYSFTSTNWFVRVREDFIGSEALPNDFEVTAQHLVAIGAGELAPNPLTMTILFFANSFTPGGPARGPFSTFVIHAPDALDSLRVSYNPLVAGQSSRITIETSHAGAVVPEPATLLLVGAGVIGAVSRRRRWSAGRSS